MENIKLNKFTFQFEPCIIYLFLQPHDDKKQKIEEAQINAKSMRKNFRRQLLPFTFSQFLRSITFPYPVFEIVVIIFKVKTPNRSFPGKYLSIAYQLKYIVYIL